MFYSGIILTLQGLVEIMPGEPDEETGEVKSRWGGGTFFWIPVIFWGVGFLALSIWLINKDPDPSGSDYSGADTEMTSGDDSKEVAVEEELSGERVVYFYNSMEDSTKVELIYNKSGSDCWSQTIPSGNIVYVTFAASEYKIFTNDQSEVVSIQGSEQEGDNFYDDAWYVLGEETDLLFVNVTWACDKINEPEIRAIDWMEKLKERYDGSSLIEPRLKTTKEGKFFTVISPGISLPVTHSEDENVFAFIPIPKGVEATDAYLDSMIVDVCF
jgi:hypothetical protein